VVQGLREGADFCWTMLGIADEGATEDGVDGIGELTHNLSGASHAGTNDFPGQHFVNDCAEAEDRGAGVAAFPGSLFWGEAGLVVRAFGQDRGALRVEANGLPFDESHSRRVEVNAFTASVTGREVSAQRDDDCDGFSKSEPLFAGATSVDGGSK
jgi:hypothetical protein